MDTSLIENVAKAVLYEGYVLYPYRPSSVKNRQRWTLGSLYPESFCRSRNGSDAWKIQAECLVDGDGSTSVDVNVRFLQLVAPGPGSSHGDDWREAVERQVLAIDLNVGDLVDHPRSIGFAFPGAEDANVQGSVEIDSTSTGDGLFRVGVRIANTTHFPASALTTHAQAQTHSIASAHVIIGVQSGQFLSSIDPGDRFRDAASGCTNIGLWPVLVGEEGSRSAMLAAPIILYDYPRVAPESHGDMFDATEIDEILTLRILTLTDAEKIEMSGFDARAGALLLRTEALDEEQLLNLHAAMRPRSPSPGDRVILRPRGRADAFDLMLAGQAATVATIERDFEDQVYVTVLVDDDPGKDLGEQGLPGHRFFFRLDEVELIARTGGGES
jgi:hypothetical protein